MPRYPGKPIELIVPYPQHGGSDNRARLLTKYLSATLSAEINVRNLNVRGGEDGHEAVAAAAPDGYTLGLISVEVGMLHWLDVTPVSPRDYTALAMPFNEPAGLVVRTDAPYRTVGDLLAAFKSRGLTGSGSPNLSGWKLALAGLLDEAGIDQRQLSWVPTLSGEEGIENMIAGRADIAPVSLADALPYIRKSQVRPLANMNTGRHPLFPDVPTVAEETGLRWTMGVWRGLAGPAGLPPEIVEALIKALRATAVHTGFVGECAKRGFTTQWLFGAEFGSFMAEDDKKLGALIRAYLAGQRVTA